MTPSRIDPQEPQASSVDRPKSCFRSWCDLAYEHLHLLVLLCVAGFPLFYSLGDDYLWSDEGDTAVLARSILQFGVPKAWDGVTFTDSDMGTRENKDLVMVSHPWLQYYVTAASFCVFGETTFAARFPFATAGWLTILVTYWLVVRATADRRAAFCACLLLVVSVQFMLFSRQCRNYSLNMFLTCLLLLQFFGLKSLLRTVAFIVTAILLFHCHPSGLAPIAALGILTLIHKPFRTQRRWFWCSLPTLLVFTLPWFGLAREGYAENTSLLKDWALFFPRLLQFLIECGSVTPIVAVVGLFLWLWLRPLRLRKFRWGSGRKLSYEVLDGGQRDLFMAILFVFLAYAALIALTISRAELWNVGLRHTTAIIPLTMALTGILVSKVSRDRNALFIGLVVILALTKLGRLTPFSFWHEEKVNFDSESIAAMHVPKTWQDRVLRTALPAFSRDLWHRNRGSVAGICKFLKTNAAPGEILITNYEWEPVYFHTRLPQGLKILPTYPIYQKVQDYGLPYYVYTVKDARWIVWRSPWNGYRDYDWKSIHESLLESGASVTKVASIPETAWENQPNVHFRRYPGNDYKYPFYEHLQDVQIYRVDWPWTTPASSSATSKGAS